MNDRVALIVGVGGATGAALARRFAQGGYRVAMIARNAERLAEIESKIPGARSYPCDVADLDRLGAVVDRVKAELGAPHVLPQRRRGDHRQDLRNLGRGAQAKLPGQHDVAVLPRPEARAGDDRARRGRHHGDRKHLVIPRHPGAPGLRADEGRPAHPRAVPFEGSGAERVHVGYITIDAVIDAPWLASARGARRIGPPADWQYERDDYFAHPDAIAEEVYHIAHQHPSTWSFDHVIRPFAESWTLN